MSILQQPRGTLCRATRGARAPRSGPKARKIKLPYDAEDNAENEKVRDANTEDSLVSIFKMFVIAEDAS
jgi:hypothetical protein